MTANEVLRAIADPATPRPVRATLGTTQMLSVCVIGGCNKLTMGGTCVDHDVPVSVVFPRGRPYVLSAAPAAAV